MQDNLSIGWQRLVLSQKLYKDINSNKNQLDIVNTKQQETINLGFGDQDIVELFFRIVSVTKKHYLNTICEMMMDMETYNFKYTKSSNPAFDTHLKHRFTDFEYLEKINLFTHTKNVVEEAIKLTQSSSEGVSSIVLLLALAHDYGKNEHIERLIPYEGGSKKHDYISAKYLKQKMLNNAEKDNLDADHIDELFQILSSHHQDTKVKTNYIANIFYQADIDARKQEIKKIKKLQEIK